MLSFQAGTSASNADVLTRESSRDDIGSTNLKSSELAHVVVARHVGPVSGEDTTAVGVDFAERDGSEAAGSFKAEAEAANARKEVEDSKHVMPHRSA